MIVAPTSKDVGAKLIYFSAISADKTSSILLAKLKGLAEDPCWRHILTQLSSGQASYSVQEMGFSM